MGRPIAIGPGGAIDPGTFIGPKRLYPVTYSTTPADFSYRHPEAALTIEREPDSGVFLPAGVIRWSFIERAISGADTIAQLIVPALDLEKLTGGASVGREHFAQLIRRLSPDVRVRVAVAQGASTAPIPLFEGYPQPITITWTADAQALQVQCLCAGQERLRTGILQQIIERYVRLDPASAWDPDAPDTWGDTGMAPIFNPLHPETGKVMPNRSAEPYPFSVGGETFEAYLFVSDAEAGAGLWTYADAMRYLSVLYILQAGAPIDVRPFLRDTAETSWSTPAPNSRDPLARWLTAQPVALPVGGLNVDEAFALIANRSGARYAIDVVVDGNDAGDPWLHQLRVGAAITGPGEDAGAPDSEMGRPVVYDVPRELPNTDHTGRSPSVIAEAGGAVSATFTIDPRSVTAPLFLGARRLFEVTLLLRPGWTPHTGLDDVWSDDDPLVSEDPGVQTKGEKIDAAIAALRTDMEIEWVLGQSRVPVSQFHRLHPDHDAVRDVMRLWVFPDSLAYFGKDYGRDRGWLEKYFSPYIVPDDPDADAFVSVFSDYDIGGGVSFDDTSGWAPRQRPFLDTIGRATRAATSKSPIVRFNFDATTPEQALADTRWSEFGGMVTVDPLRGAIYFADDNPWWPSPHFALDPEHDPNGPNWFTAYVRGTFWVSVTCTIEGERLQAFEQLPGSRRGRSQVIDTGTTFQHSNRRGQNSHLNAQAIDETEYEGADDRTEFAAFAKREASLMGGDVVSGDPEIFYLDPRYKVGDSFRGISGLGIPFPSYPEIIRVRYMRDDAASYRTILHTEDLRNAPEVGSE